MRIALAVLVLVVLVGGLPAAATDGRGLFVDDDGSVHESDINGLGVAGISRGCNPPHNDRFCPDQPVTRAQLASFLVRALDIPSSSEHRFGDTTDSVHTADIRAIATAGITRGCNPPDNDRFCPDQPVTRAQLASFLVRALDLPVTSDRRFADIGDTVHAADIRAIAAAGITRGCNPPDNDRYCPRQAVTRAEMASFLLRSVPGVDPIPNHLSVRSGLTCAKNTMTCTKRLSLRHGVDLSIREGWYHVLPYLPGESAAFTSAATRVTFSWNGTPLAPAYVGLSESATMADRHWQIRPPSIRRGVNTLRVAWHWQGEVTQTATVTITGT